MKVINFTVEVHGEVAMWAANHNDPVYRDCRYRLYSNGDLLIERTWLWNNDLYVEENCFLQVLDTNEFTITLEPVLKHLGAAKFYLKNLKFKNVALPLLHVEEHSIKFKLQ